MYGFGHQYVSVVDTNRLEKHRDIPLLSALKEYSLQDIAAFDVPGHKRGQGVKVLNQYFGHELMRMDVNSLPLLDNVSNAKGVIKDTGIVSGCLSCRCCLFYDKWNHIGDSLYANVSIQTEAI